MTAMTDETSSELEEHLALAEAALRRADAELSLAGSASV